MKSLKIKFIIYLIPLVLLISVAFLFFYLFRSEYVIEEGLTDIGFHLVKNLSHSSQLAISIDDGFLLQPAFVDALFEEQGVVLVAVYDKNGNTILSRNETGLEERISSDVMRDVVNAGAPLKRITENKQGETVYDFYAPILIGKASVVSGPRPGNLVGFSRVSLSTDKIKLERSQAIRLGLSITGLVILLGFFMSVFLGGRLVTPIMSLIKGTEAITSGNLDYELRIKTGDEIERLAKHFNQMIKSLKKSRQELEESRDVLEIKVTARTKELREQAEGLDGEVKIRTKELQERIDELERFHKLTVGRELKMIELKRKIQEFEKQIKSSRRKKKTTGSS